MTGFEVLPAVALGEELAELVVADAALAQRRADARLPDRARDRT